MEKLTKLEKVIFKFEALLESYEDFEPDEGQEKDFKKSQKIKNRLIKFYRLRRKSPRNLQFTQYFFKSYKSATGLDC